MPTPIGGFEFIFVLIVFICADKSHPCGDKGRRVGNPHLASLSVIIGFSSGKANCMTLVY